MVMKGQESEEKIMDALRDTAPGEIATMSYRELVMATGLCLQTVVNVLLRLRLQGRIEKISGGIKTSYRLTKNFRELAVKTQIASSATMERKL